MNAAATRGSLLAALGTPYPPMLMPCSPIFLVSTSVRVSR